MTTEFPSGFLWGAATAAYQIEGGADADSRGRSVWDTFSHTPGRTRHGDTGDVACDHYHRMPEDVDLMADLGLHAYRFSVSWPRVQPDGRGPANEAGLDFYRRLVDALLERSIVPFVTLYHWDLPQALQDAGGWATRDTAGRFADYAELVHRALGDRVEDWITLNEPWVVTFLGHVAGVHAPGLTDPAAGMAAAHHLLLGHGEAVAAVRADARGDTRVGITVNLSPARPASYRPEDRAAAATADAMSNRLFLDPLLCGSYPAEALAAFDAVGSAGVVADADLETVAAPIDFLGVNYYYPTVVRAGTGDEPGSGLPGAEYLETLPPTGPTTAMGWAIDPRGLHETLLRIDRDYGPLPLYVTENGAAFEDYVDPTGAVRDPERVAYLAGHLRAARAAIDEGVDLRGYFVWSLLDNFEWAEGYAKRFGLTFVDYRTQVRIPKASSYWYAHVIGTNALPDAGDVP